MTEDMLWPTDDDAAEPDQNPSALALALSEAPLVEEVGSEINIETLLTFLPDPALKAELDAMCTSLLDVDVTTDEGLSRIDEGIAEIGRKIKSIDECFEYPTSLANKLHKRMTGWRAEIKRSGMQALPVLRNRLRDEVRRRDRIARELQRQAQQAADAAAREAAALNVKQAEASGAPKEIVGALRAHAEHASAPRVSAPVSPVAMPTQTAVAEKWKARLRGTTEDDPVNPSVDEMTPAQLESFRAVLRAVLDGTLKIGVLAGINWSYVNRIAGADKTQFSMAGLEAFDQGQVRRKG